VFSNNETRIIELFQQLQCSRNFSYRNALFINWKLICSVTWLPVAM